MNNKVTFWIIAAIIIGIVIFNYNPDLFSNKETPAKSLTNQKVIYESKNCNEFLSQIKDSGWGFKCDTTKEDCAIHFSEARLLWKSQNRCIIAMDDEDNQCKIVYTEGVC